jgi:hypothetical protein
VSQPNQAESISVHITIREPVQPADRGDRYEDPLFEALERAGLGGPGDGGGTLCNQEGEIEEVDFDVEITSLDAIPVIARFLEHAGAPRGSELSYDRRGEPVVVPFGVVEGVAIYLDGVTLPQEIYDTTSAQELADQLTAVLGDDGELRASWQGPRETALYLYGRDAELVFARVEPVLRAYPLGRNARVVVRHGTRPPGPREVRLSAPVASA